MNPLISLIALENEKPLQILDNTFLFTKKQLVSAITRFLVLNNFILIIYIVIIYIIII